MGKPEKVRAARVVLTKSEQMARVRSRDTKPEIFLRKALFEQGVRYRLHRSDLPGTPDVYIGRLRLAVFVNGCFWHGHDCRRGKIPSSNVAYWRAKIERNKARDERTKSALDEMGIESLVLWTCRVGEFAAQAQTLAERYRSFAV
jgi:DNA mismatch endonuclease (patch repair protein)